MSLEYALERYPMTHRLGNGSTCTIRPLKKSDSPRLREFLLAVPEQERMFVKFPVDDRAFLQKWCRSVDFEEHLPLLMLQGDRVIGEASLHQRPGGWKRHIGSVGILTHPEFRAPDVTTTLMQEVISVARHAGLTKLETELNGDRKGAINAMEQLGFRQLVRLADYLVDMKREAHDYVLMGMELITDEEYASAG